MTTFSPASKARLTAYDLARFPGDSLFDAPGRAVCRAGCLPRKELYEAWEVARRARRVFRGVAVLPCCHDVETCDAGPLGGWLDAPLAIDVTRATQLVARGYRVRTRTIPAVVTPKNRLLLGAPAVTRR